MGSIPQSQDKWQGLRGTLGVALQEGGIWEFGAVAMLGTLPWLWGKILQLGVKFQVQLEGRPGKGLHSSHGLGISTTTTSSPP